MKRFLILLVTLLFGFTLAACDNFTQIQEFSREYCEQNPNDEVCQLDAIDNLTEAEILQLFNAVLENYNNAEYANFCDEFFSVTNKVLLDDCREATTNLVPADFEGFSEITYDSNASNNYYVITGVTLDGLNIVEFRVQVVLEDGGYLISYWSFTSTPVEITCGTGEILENGECVPEPIVCEDGFVLEGNQCVPETVVCDAGFILEDGQCVPETLVCDEGFILEDGQCLPVDPLEVSYDEAKAFLQNFIDMYLDPSVPSDEFCPQYFVEDPEGCIDDRSEGHSNGADIILEVVTELGEGVFAADMMFYDFEGDEGRPQYQKFLLTKDEFGNIIIEFIDNRVPLELATQIFTNLLADFQNPNIPIEEIAMNYFMGEIPDDIAQDRAKVLLEGITYEVTGSYENDYSEYVLVFIVTFPDGFEEVEVPFMVYEVQADMYVIDVRDDNGYDPDQEQFIHELVDNYLNPNMSSVDWCTIYWGPDELDEGCAEERDETLALPDAFIDLVWIDYRDGMMVIMIHLGDGTEVMEAEIMVEFVYDEFGIQFVRFHDIMSDPEQEEFIHALFDTYLDPNWDSQAWCDEFFGPEEGSGCVEDRDEALAIPEFYVVLEWMDFYDGMMKIGIRMSDGTEEMYDELLVEFFYDEFGISYVRFESHMVNPEEEAFINMLFDTYLDTSWSSQEWCNTFFGPDQEESCAIDRDEVLQNPNFYVQLLWIERHDGMVRIGLDMSDGIDVFYQEIMVEFIYDEFGILYVRFHEDMRDPMQEDFINELFATYMDPAWDSQDWCNTFFGPEQEEDCAIDRDEAIQNPDFYVHLQWMNWEDGMMRIGIEMYDGFESKYEEMFVEFMYFENMIQYVRFMPGYMIDPEWENFIYGLANDFNDFQIDSQSICEHYFEGTEEINGCVQKRLELIESSGYVLVEYIYHGEYGVELGFRWFMNGEEWVEDILAHFYYNENNMLKVKFEDRHYYQFPWDEAESILNQLILDFNDTTINNADFCYMWFPHLDATNCFLDRESFAGQTYTAYYEWMDMGPDGFRVGLGIQLPDINEDQHYVIGFAPYYDEFGELQIHWWYDNHQSGVDYEIAISVLEQLLAEFPSPATDTDFIYNLYSRGDWNALNDIKQYLLNSEVVDMQLMQFNFYGWDADIEVLLTDIYGNQWQEYFKVYFYEQDGQVFLDLYFSEPFNGFPEHEARAHLEWILSIYNDGNVSDDDACMIMPRIIEDCHAYRQEMFLNNATIELLDFWQEYNNNFGANILFIDFTNGSNYQEYFSFQFWYNSDQTIQMQMNQPMPPFRWATFEEAQDLWTQWVTDYQDPAMTEQQFADKWFFGHYPEDFFQGRRDQMAAGVYYIMIDFIDDGMMGPDAFRFIIEHHVNNDVMVQEDYVMFRIFEDGTFQIEFTSQHGPNIDYNQAMNLIDAFFNDMRDSQIPTTEICQTYFPGDLQVHCQTIVDNDFRAFEDFDWFYLDEYDGHYDMGVDFYANGMMVHSLFYFIYFMQNEYGDWYFDLEEHPDMYNQFSEQFGYMDNLQFYLDNYFVDPNLLSELCDAYFYNDPNCGWITDLFNDDLIHAYHTGFWWEMDELDMVTFHADLHFDYMDGSWIRVKYNVFFDVDSNNVMKATLEEVGRTGSAPITAVLQDEATTIAVLTEFAWDYGDINVDPYGLCNVYFNDFMESPECLEGRQEFLDAAGIANFSHLDAYIDNNGVPYYEAWFDLTQNGITDTVNGQMRVYLLDDGRYFIEFMDMYGEPDFIDYTMFYNRLYEFVDAYNLPSNSDEYICDEFFDYPVGDGSCEPDRQTALALGSMLVILSVNEDVWIDNQLSYVIEFEIINNDPALNLLYTVHYLPWYDVDGDIVFGYTPMP